MHFDLYISIAEAALGVSKEIDLLEGKVRIKLESGIQSGKTLRLRGKGIPDLNGYGKGDLLVHVNVWTPKTNLLRIVPGNAERQSTKATVTVTTIITTAGAILTAAIAVRRVWEVPSKRLTANNASALIPIPNPKRNRRDVVKKSTRAMATVTMITTTKPVISTAVTVAQKVWVVL